MGIEKNIFQQAYSQGKGLITSENKNLLVPIPDIVEGKAMGILKGAGLGFLKAKFFRINAAQAAEEKVANGEVIELGGKSKTGFFGLPIWDTVKLSFDTFSDNEGNSVTGEEMEFDIALIDVTNVRNIVKTPIAGKNGTIKEYMSEGDSNVTIRGCLINNGDTAPLSNILPIDLLKKFSTIVSVPVTLDVTSSFLLYMGIKNLVIEQPTIKQREGTRNVYDFELSCVSDLPYTFDESNA